jgi:hypothetical protein
MRHFHRTSVPPADVLAAADEFFPTLGLTAMPAASGERARGFTGALGTVRIEARPEGGHYTFVEAVTDQMGESRMDRNVKQFFVRLHRRTDPTHALDASF